VLGEGGGAWFREDTGIKSQLYHEANFINYLELNLVQETTPVELR
jgi:hypothetical protein